MEKFNLDDFMESEQFKNEMQKLKEHGDDANFTGITKLDKLEYMERYQN